LSLTKEKLNLKRKSTDITHSLQCVLKFQSDHAQWRSKRGQVGACAPECRPWRRINTLYSDIFKKWFFSRNLAKMCL